MKYTDIRGIIVPILTPMDENEQINLPVLREQIERMIVGGVNGIFPLGTNGEAYILSEKEKLEVLETAIDHDNYLEFQQVLSDIGEALEARFVLEDKLILLVLDAARVKYPA